ncbi:MAG: hypothetical protein H7125_15230, partial [Proteobacteria bacterium]|nr:hypothetical protein [Burkholderiales bacterium]
MNPEPSRRRVLLAATAALAGSALATGCATTEPASVALMTAGEGSAFLPYGRGIAKVVTARSGIAVEVRTSGGSNENLGVVEREPMILGTAFLGSAFEAVNGIAFAAGRRHENVRALFPMYETSFQTATLRSRKLTRTADLDGRRVGVGPTNGPAEGYFRGLA